HVNQDAEFLSRQVVRPEEWCLHPQVVEHVWQIFGRAEVEESTYCQLWYSFSHLAPLGLDALVQTWPRLHLHIGQSYTPTPRCGRSLGLAPEGLVPRDRPLI
ncbi:hypothetical protein QTP86_016511, partial [Hemibagrus guttatus]